MLVRKRKVKEERDMFWNKGKTKVETPAPEIKEKITIELGGRYIIETGKEGDKRWNEVIVEEFSPDGLYVQLLYPYWPTVTPGVVKVWNSKKGVEECVLVKLASKNISLAHPELANSPPDTVPSREA
jgi:hypothetical protein